MIEEKIYMLDDSQSIVDVLKLIITKAGIGSICGHSTSVADALDDLHHIKPDIIIVDLLMPEMDGITFVSKASKIVPDASFVMLSQVSSKDMISGAYEAGVEFYMQKPINGIEVINVLKNVIEKRTYMQKLKMLNDILDTGAISAGGSSATKEEMEDAGVEKIKDILSKFGMLGTNGVEDTITVCRYFLETGIDPGSMTIKDVCSKFSDTPKSMEQKIRRAASVGLTNLAHMCINDFDNLVLQEYGIPVFGYEQIRKEMDYIQGKTGQHGIVKMKNYITSLVYHSKQQ